MLVRGEDSVWQRELREAGAQWQEQLRVWQWHGERACDLRYEVNTATWKGPILELYDVVLTSYESFLANHEKFLQESWTCVVLDEAQTIKNHNSQTANAVKRLAQAPFRLALTGSPIENSLDDMHSILQFVEPSCCGSLQDFRQRFAGTEEGRALLQKLLHSVMLRRDSGEAVQMVAREEVEVQVVMAPDQTNIYQVLQQELSSPEISIHKQLRDMELLCTHPWCYLQRPTGEDLHDDALTRRGVARQKNSPGVLVMALVTLGAATLAPRTAPCRAPGASGREEFARISGAGVAAKWSGGVLAAATAAALTRKFNRRSAVYLGQFGASSQ
ncbi:unnamed protein product [Effrenium voratum]|nr:unnamed protein product [Effrenium voratum]